MKKILCFILSAVLLVSLSACASVPGSSESRVEEKPSITESDAPATEQNEEAAEESPAEDTVDEGTDTAPNQNEVPADYAPDITFTTADRDGNEWTEEAFAGQELTMINFWEYWCHGCVEEMPDLNKLYEEYKDQGLLILGVYGSDNSSTEQDITDTIKNTGVTYPNLRYCQEFSIWLDDLLPVTVFLDKNGKVIGEPIIGSRSYEEWAEIIEELL